MKHVRKYVWVDPYLHRLIDEKGIELSAFINKSMAAFLDLPEDPTEKILRENIEDSMIRVRLSYMNSIRGRLSEQDLIQSKEDAEKAKQKELTDQLEKFGKMLQKTSVYSRCLKALKTMDMEAPCWDTALQQLNNMNGNSYTFEKMWDNAREWYRKCISVTT